MNRLTLCVLCVLYGGFFGGCSSEPDPPARPQLRPVPLPDLSKLTGSVQAQVRERHDALSEQVASAATPAAALGDAFGEMGKLLMAVQFPEGAEAAFVNARTLDGADFRWSYYLAHLARGKGDLPGAAALLERVLELQPNDVAALFWLGDVYLAQGRADLAEPRFSKALSIQPDSLSARFGLGRAALAREEYRKAVELFEEVLTRDPGAAGVHYPLALAYAGLGDTARSDVHLRQRREHEILPADPLMVELEQLLHSPETYEKQGIRALDRQDWPGAAEQFRKGLEIDPKHAALRHRLGTALFMMGDARGARDQFEEVLRDSPSFARAHYSLGVLAASDGRSAEAIEWFSTAVRHDPNYAEARLRLAATLRRVGRPGESIAHYDQVLSANPADTDARFGQAVALAELRRYGAARDSLREAIKAYPDQPVFRHALARLLAAAPDDSVRDGQQALALAQDLARTQRTPDVGETLAMALAEVGRYDEAAAIQRDLIAGGEKAGRHDIVRRLAENLQRYERGEPCRTPWTKDELP